MIMGQYWDVDGYTLWLCQNSYNDPVEIDALPIVKLATFNSYVSHDQRVYSIVGSWNSHWTMVCGGYNYSIHEVKPNQLTI